MKVQSINLNEITSNSLFEIKKLDSSYFPCPWSPEAWTSCLAHSENYELFIFMKDEVLIGFSLYQVSKLEGLSHLLKIIIDPNYRKFGYAKLALMENLSFLSEKSLGRIYLEVETTNIAAIELYKKCGLKIIHTKNNFYGSERHALIMMNA